MPHAGIRHGITAALALAALAAPRLITAAPLDLLGDAAIQADPAEEPGANFPGSAFFFTQGLFDRLPAPQPGANPAVLTLDAAQAAPATAFRGATALDSYRALNCLTSAIYYEAGNEPEEGQRAVAQVVLNRVRSPLWPHSVCAVVYQGSERTDLRCQFTFSCDGSMTRGSDRQSWARARRIAQEALSGKVYAPVGLATFYHTLAVRPSWAPSLRPVAIIGAHIFYRMPGFQGAPAAFRVAYSGREYQSGPAPRPWMPAPVIASPVYDWAKADAPAILPVPSVTRPPEDEPALPESTIRPEYRNSGRPRI
ncbi:cell wall hydrolase [Sphingobium sp. DC-2]|nr:cell wall hydrolase [Sphingobium sp. DC-2]